MSTPRVLTAFCPLDGGRFRAVRPFFEGHKSLTARCAEDAAERLPARLAQCTGEGGLRRPMAMLPITRRRSQAASIPKAEETKPREIKVLAT